MRVIVSGGGIGGLATAQGLRRAGHEVVVLERGELPRGPSGYRLRIDPVAVAALGRLLPDDVLAALLASGASGAGHATRVYADHRLRPMGELDDADGRDQLMIGRGPLQRLLARGLDDAIVTGAEATDYRVSADDVVVTLAGGREVAGDAVVIAEGVHSPLRDQLLGGPTHRDLHAGTLGSRVPGTPADLGLPALAALLDRHEVVLAFGPGGVLVFLSAHQPARESAFDPLALGPDGPEIEDPYVVWGVIGAEDVVPGDVDGVARLLRRWHPEVARLAAASDPDQLARLHFYAGTPLPSWPTTAVTAIGDAVHVVPPTGGIGASTALRDAGLLVGELDGVVDRPGLLRAFRRYEQATRAYAGEVVDRSVAPLRWRRAVAHPAVHATVTGGLVAARRVRERLGR